MNFVSFSLLGIDRSIYVNVDQIAYVTTDCDDHTVVVLNRVGDEEGLTSLTIDGALDATIVDIESAAAEECTLCDVLTSIDALTDEIKAIRQAMGGML